VKPHEEQSGFESRPYGVVRRRRGSAWRWLASIGREVDQPGLRVAVDAADGAVLAVQARRDRLDGAIGELAATPPWVPVVARLGCRRGVGVLTSFGLAVEIGDWQRFTGATIGAWLGLVPSEQSGGGRRCQGSITKTGTRHARRLLVEAAWHHRQPSRPSRDLQARHAGQPAAVRERADRRRPPTPPALVPAGCSGQALHHQRGRGRSRAGWMVLEPGRPGGLTDTHSWPVGRHPPARERPATHR
jgi:hypothetical protein